MPPHREATELRDLPDVPAAAESPAGLSRVAVVVIAIVYWVMQWLYRRSTKEVAFVRTGFLGEKVVIDSVSLPFLAGATIDFSEELIGARFAIENILAGNGFGLRAIALTQAGMLGLTRDPQTGLVTRAQCRDDMPVVLRRFGTPQFTIK